MKRSLILLIIGSLLVGFAIGWSVNNTLKKSPIVTAIRSVPRVEISRHLPGFKPQLETELKRSSRPEIRYIYQDKIKTERIEIEVPVLVRDSFYVTTPNPIKINYPILSKPQARFTYYNPSTNQYATEGYSIRAPRVKYGAEAELSASPDIFGAVPKLSSVALETKAYLGYKSLQAFAGYRFESGDSGPIVGIRVRLGR